VYFLSHHKLMAFFSVLLWTSLALSTASSKIAGVAWLALVLWGMFNWWVHRNEPTAHNTAQTASQTWVMVCLVALVLRSVGVVYWGESWAERHAEIRLLLGSLGLYGMLRFNSFGASAVFDGDLFIRRTNHAISLACLIGFGIALFGGRDALTTNAIPWAAGMAMLTVWMTHATFFVQGPSWERYLWALGALFGVLAVLVSETRGAYGVVIWVALVFIWNTRKWLNGKRLLFGAGPLLLAIGLLYKTPVVQQPLGRVHSAITEFQASSEHKADAQNSSVGARLVLWQLAKQAVPQSLWVGYGQKQRLDMIKDWGRQQQSETVTSLGHMHNQYLHDLMDHGLLGLASDLMYLVGLAGLGLWLLKRRHVFAGLALGGVAFMHATTSLTNVNFAHNYYPTVMAVVVGLALMSLMRAEGDDR
jgi:O-antigen ligase